MRIITIEWGNKIYRMFSVYFYRQHYQKIGIHTNGATKKDKCLDWQFWILGLKFNYLNFNYDKQP